METSFRVNNTKMSNFKKSKRKLAVRMSRGFSTMGNSMELSDFASDLIGTSFRVNTRKLVILRYLSENCRLECLGGFRG